MGTDSQCTRRVAGRARARAVLVLSAFLLVVAAGIALPGGTAADQASEPTSAAARQLDAGRNHTCALLPEATVRCWGFSREGELGYGNTNTIGDDETPGAAGPVNLGAGRTAVSIGAGDYHTCAVLENATVRCWGFGQNGRLGYGNQDTIGDNEDPASAGPVDFGAGHTAKAVAAGGAHTCAILDDNTVRCWGYAFYGQLGYGNPGPDPQNPANQLNPLNIGDDETPGSVGPVNLGPGRTAKAIAAGDLHTCAILDDDTVRCWGYGANGQLGYANTNNVGDRGTPDLAGPPGPVDLGAGRKAKAIAAGVSQTCAVLDDGSVRCWGFGGDGRLGSVGVVPIGDDETPGSVPPVNLGAGRTAKAIGVGDGHACALLDNDAARCWGFNIDGRLGYGTKTDVGDDETPGSVGPVNLGVGRSARAIALGGRHTCARLDDGSVRCWGYGGNGRLGYCNETNIGDNELPASAGPVDLGIAGSGAPACAPPVTGSSTTPPQPAQTGGGNTVYPLAAEAARRRAFRGCLGRVGAHSRREVRRARRLSGRRRALARRHVKRHRSRLRRACVRRYGRKPGRVTGLRAKASRTKVDLTFIAPGSNGRKPPAARTYLIKQSRRPIRGARGFRRAQTLCKGRCHFSGVTEVGATIKLTVTDLRRRTTYYYAVAARDNVTGRLGPRSRPARAKTH